MSEAAIVFGVHVLLGLEVFFGALAFAVGSLIFARTDYAFDKFKGVALYSYFAAGYALLIGGLCSSLLGFVRPILPMEGRG